MHDELAFFVVEELTICFEQKANESAAMGGEEVCIRLLTAQFHALDQVVVSVPLGIAVRHAKAPALQK